MADKENKTDVVAVKADKPAKADAKSSPAKKDKESFGKRTAKFFREYRSELKKVVWSTPSQTLNNTILVAVSVVVVSIGVGILDFAFYRGLSGIRELIM